MSKVANNDVLDVHVISKHACMTKYVMNKGFQAGLCFYLFIIVKHLESSEYSTVSYKRTKLCIHISQQIHYICNYLAINYYNLFSSKRWVCDYLLGFLLFFSSKYLIPNFFDVS